MRWMLNTFALVAIVGTALGGPAIGFVAGLLAAFVASWAFIVWTEIQIWRRR